MPTLTVSDATYRRITVSASALSLSVDQYLESLASGPTAAAAGPSPDWERELELMSERARARAGRYPPGFQVDDSREAIYEERLAAQR